MCNRYESAKEIYVKYAIDTDVIIKNIEKIPVSLHCWQGDDVKGFDQTLSPHRSCIG